MLHEFWCFAEVPLFAAVSEDIFDYTYLGINGKIVNHFFLNSEKMLYNAY